MCEGELNKLRMFRGLDVCVCKVLLGVRFCGLLPRNLHL